MHKCISVGLAVLTTIVMLFGFAGCMTSVGRPASFGMALVGQCWVEFLSRGGCLGVVVITSDDPDLVPRIDGGRAYVPVFDGSQVGPFRFELKWRQNVSWYYAPSPDIAPSELEWQDFTGSSPACRTDIYVPLWVAVIVLGAIPLHAFYGPVVRWRRKRFGWCVACGYDLRGSTNRQCPECGTTFEGGEI